MKINNKPMIETVLNSIAIGITSVGINLLISKDYFGFLLIFLSVGAEFFKYWGRNKKLW